MFKHPPMLCRLMRKAGLPVMAARRGYFRVFSGVVYAKSAFPSSQCRGESDHCPDTILQGILVDVEGCGVVSGCSAKLLILHADKGK